MERRGSTPLSIPLVQVPVVKGGNSNMEYGGLTPFSTA